MQFVRTRLIQVQQFVTQRRRHRQVQVGQRTLGRLIVIVEFGKYAVHPVERGAGHEPDVQRHVTAPGARGLLEARGAPGSAGQRFGDVELGLQHCNDLGKTAARGDIKLNDFRRLGHAQRILMCALHTELEVQV